MLAKWQCQVLGQMVLITKRNGEILGCFPLYCWNWKHWFLLKFPEHDQSMKLRVPDPGSISSMEYTHVLILCKAGNSLAHIFIITLPPPPKFLFNWILLLNVLHNLMVRLFHLPYHRKTFLALQCKNISLQNHPQKNEYLKGEKKSF